MEAKQARRHVRRADFRVADWVVRPSVDRVSRGEKSIHLRPKLMDVLVYLTSRPGEVVSKEELLEAVWPQLFVEESALTRAVADLRQLLEDDAHRPAIIETIPKRGYRLIASVLDGNADRARLSAARPEVPPLPFKTPAFTAGGEPFIGRERELDRLTGMLERTCNGAGSIAFVTGEVGTGKTALLAEFVRRAQGKWPELVIAQANSPMPGPVVDPYAPFRQVLARITGDIEAPLAAGVLDHGQAERLWRLIPRAVNLLTDVAPDLLDFFVPSAPLLARARAAATSGAAWLMRLEQHVTAERGSAQAPVRREDLVSETIDFLQAIAREHALLLVFDDLQWADASSVSLLFQLAGEIPGHRVLMLGAYRPAEVMAVSDGKRHPLETAVNELVRRFGESTILLPEQGDQAFVDALLDAEPNRLGPKFRCTLYKQTRGHPLFTVELLRTMRQQGALVKGDDGCWQEGERLDWDTLPARMEAALAERIARLPGELRRLLAIASVEGEEFTAEVVARVAGLSEREVVHALAEEIDRRHRLARLQSVTHVGGARVSIYRFDHIVTQRYLLAGLDEAQRGYLHEAVGNALEALYGPAGAEITARLAWHFQQSGAIAKAIEYLRQAGERALQLSADQDAVAHFSAAIALLDQLPPSTKHDAAELQFQLALLLPLLRLTSGAAPELAPAFRRAHSLAMRVPASPETFSAFIALMMTDAMRGEYVGAVEAADRSVAVAAQLGDPALIVISRWLPGAIRLRTGELDRSRRDLETALPGSPWRAVIARNRVAPGIEIDPQMAPGFIHPDVWRLCWLGYCLWFMGYPDQALAREKQAVALAEEIGDRNALYSALGIQTSVLLHCGQGAAAQESLDAALQTGKAMVTDFMQFAVAYFQGWALVQLGQLHEGLAHLERVISAVRMSGLRLDWTKLLATFASASLKAGQIERAAAAVSEALEAAAVTGEHYYEPELCRLRGEILSAAGSPPAEAEQCFQQALQIAQAQHAKSWELRTTTSLARLWAENGRKADALAALASVLGWFTEGFATPDLQTASRLLRELESPLQFVARQS